MRAIEVGEMSIRTYDDLLKSNLYMSQGYSSFINLHTTHKRMKKSTRIALHTRVFRLESQEALLMRKAYCHEDNLK